MCRDPVEGQIDDGAHVVSRRPFATQERQPGIEVPEIALRATGRTAASAEPPLERAELGVRGGVVGQQPGVARARSGSSTWASDLTRPSRAASCGPPSGDHSPASRRSRVQLRLVRITSARSTPVESRKSGRPWSPARREFADQGGPSIHQLAPDVRQDQVLRPLVQDDLVNPTAGTGSPSARSSPKTRLSNPAEIAFAVASAR